MKHFMITSSILLSLTACDNFTWKRPQVDHTEQPGTVEYFCPPDEAARGLCGQHDRSLIR